MALGPSQETSSLSLRTILGERDASEGRNFPGGLGLWAFLWLPSTPFWFRVLPRLCGEKMRRMGMPWKKETRTCQ